MYTQVKKSYVCHKFCTSSTKVDATYDSYCVT
jgi:hypothetical protein